MLVQGGLLQNYVTLQASENRTHDFHFAKDGSPKLPFKKHDIVTVKAPEIGLAQDELKAILLDTARVLWYQLKMGEPDGNEEVVCVYDT